MRAFGKNGEVSGAEIEKIADGWLQEITYTCETLSYFEDGNKAYVRVHVTRSLDIENQDMSQETMMNYLEIFSRTSVSESNYHSLIC